MLEPIRVMVSPWLPPGPYKPTAHIMWDKDYDEIPLADGLGLAYTLCYQSDEVDNESLAMVHEWSTFGIVESVNELYAIAAASRRSAEALIRAGYLPTEQTDEVAFLSVCTWCVLVRIENEKEDALLQEEAN